MSRYDNGHIVRNFISLLQQFILLLRKVITFFHMGNLINTIFFFFFCILRNQCNHHYLNPLNGVQFGKSYQYINGIKLTFKKFTFVGIIDFIFTPLSVYFPICASIYILIRNPGVWWGFKKKLIFFYNVITLL